MVGSLAVALAALAAARALLGSPEPAVAASLEDEDEEDEDEEEAEPAVDPAALAARYGRGNGWPTDAGSGAAPAQPAGVAGVEAIYGAPAPPSAAERNRQLYDQRLRFSPRAAEARALIARLRDDPDDDEAQRAFDQLAGPRRRSRLGPVATRKQLKRERKRRTHGIERIAPDTAVHEAEEKQPSSGRKARAAKPNPA